MTKSFQTCRAIRVIALLRQLAGAEAHYDHVAAGYVCINAMESSTNPVK